jgi:hypothetical protein
MRHGLAAASFGLLFLAAAPGCAGSLTAHTGIGGPPPPPPPGPATVTAEASVSVEISFFGVPLQGADDVVFVLDRSGSMSGVSAGVSGRQVGMSKTESALAGLGGSIANKVAGDPLPSKLEAAQDELIATLAAMPDGTRFGVIFFDREIAALSPRMWVLTPDSRARAAAFIRGIRPRGTTAAVPAMQLAYRMGARRVILLSDGLANTGGNGGDLVRDARAQAARGVRIDTVGLGIDQDDGVLETMATLTGGIAVKR